MIIFSYKVGFQDDRTEKAILKINPYSYCAASDTQIRTRLIIDLQEVFMETDLRELMEWQTKSHLNFHFTFMLLAKCCGTPKHPGPVLSFLKKGNCKLDGNQ